MTRKKGKSPLAKQKAYKRKVKVTITGVCLFIVLIQLLTPALLSKAAMEQFLMFLENPMGYLKELYDEQQKETWHALTGYSEYDYNDQIPLSESEINAMLISAFNEKFDNEQESFAKKAEAIVDIYNLDRDLSMSSFYTATNEYPTDTYLSVLNMYSMAYPQKSQASIENMLKPIENIDIFNKLHYSIHETVVSTPVKVPIYEKVWMLTLENPKAEKDLTDTTCFFMLDNEGKSKKVVMQAYYRRTGEYEYIYEAGTVISNYIAQSPIFEYTPGENESIKLTGYYDLYLPNGEISVGPKNETKQYAVFWLDSVDVDEIAKRYGLTDLDKPFEDNDNEISDTFDITIDINKKLRAAKGEPDIDYNSLTSEEQALTYRNALKDRNIYTAKLMEDVEYIYDFKTNMTKRVSYDTIMELWNNIQSSTNIEDNNRKQLILNALSLQGLVPYQSGGIPTLGTYDTTWNTNIYTADNKIVKKGLSSIGFVRWCLLNTGFPSNVTSQFYSVNTFQQGSMNTSTALKEIPKEDIKIGDIGILWSANDKDRVIEIDKNADGTTSEHENEIFSEERNLVGIYIGEQKYANKTVSLWISCSPVTGTISIIGTASVEPMLYRNNVLSQDIFNDVYGSTLKFSPSHIYSLGSYGNATDLYTGNMPDYSKIYLSTNGSSDTLLLAKIVSLACMYGVDDEDGMEPRQKNDARKAVASCIANRYDYQVDHVISDLAKSSYSLYNFVYKELHTSRYEMFFAREVEPTEVGEGSISDTYNLKCASTIEYQRNQLNETLEALSSGGGIPNLTALSMEDIAIASDVLKGNRILPENVIYYKFYRMAEENNNMSAYQPFMLPTHWLINENGKVAIRVNQTVLPYQYTYFTNTYFYQKVQDMCFYCLDTSKTFTFDANNTREYKALKFARRKENWSDVDYNKAIASIFTPVVNRLKGSQSQVVK